MWVFDRQTTPWNLRDSQMTLLWGSDAYRLLLRVACGLESEIIGETDIFGQVKRSWETYQIAQQKEPIPFSRWIHRLFEDTKEIRSLYLQNLGGNSYGSLARRIIQTARKNHLHPTETILLVGSGQLGQSVAPLLAKLSDARLLICNRSPESAQKLAHSVHANAIPAVDEKKAWASAHHVVLCTPPHSTLDPIRSSYDAPQIQSVIHLGYPSKIESPWAKVPHFFCLEDLFELEKDCTSLRKTQVDAASRACNEKAMLHALTSESGGPSHLAHGWEDLALFG